jgi:transcriptional regulator with XRE-family HTH domain
MPVVPGTTRARPPTPRQRAFGDRVREHRHAAGLTQEAFAEKAGIHRTYVASLEAGMRNPSLDLMARIALALGVDLAELTAGLQAKKGR